MIKDPKINYEKHSGCPWYGPPIKNGYDYFLLSEFEIDIYKIRITICPHHDYTWSYWISMDSISPTCSPSSHQHCSFDNNSLYKTFKNIEDAKDQIEKVISHITNIIKELNLIKELGSITFPF